MFELFGQDCRRQPLSVIQPFIDKQFCPFLQKECMKPRKSEPHIKIGVCSVETPEGQVAICEHRFTKDLLDKVRNIYAPGWDAVCVDQVEAAVGRIDWTILNIETQEFICVEQQTCGTTGSYWPWVEHYKKTGNFDSQDKKAFGLNKANEFLKTMMQQIYSKGKMVEEYGSKLIVVVQDVAISYLHENTDTSSLVTGTDKSVCFCSFRMVSENDAFVFKHHECLTTDLAGVEKMLGRGTNQISKEKFLDNIYARAEKILS